jgi:membrane protein YqaA with SNARE-associated domain
MTRQDVDVRTIALSGATIRAPDMLRRLYDWTLTKAEHPGALWFLALISFAESSVFPITPLVMLVPMVLARPDRAWLIAFVCTAASVAGGIFGYWIGSTLYEEVGRPVLELYGKADKFEEFTVWFNRVGVEAVLVAAITPFPYKVITIASGVTGLGLGTLIGASILGRGLQFFGVTAVVWYFGDRARALLERHMTLVAVGTAILLIGGFALVRMLG